MARCRFLGLHADLPQLQGLLDEEAEVLLLGHLLGQLGDLRPPVLAGLGGVQQVHGEGVRLPAHRPEQVLPGLWLHCPHGALFVSGPRRPVSS
jgi:hypothetical protein